jgi:arylsulfatase
VCTLSDRPNILFVFTDQQRADTLGALNPVIRTPVMDRLSSEGTAFTRAYTPVPVCVPARCSLIFGQYAHKTDCFENSFDMPEMTPERPTFMSVLAEAGYQTHGVGKMHFRPKPRALLGFESREYVGDAARHPEENDYLTWLHSQGYDHVVDDLGVRGEMYYVPQPAQMPASAHVSSWVADRSIAFLEQRDPSRPFFLWSSYQDPHPPFAPPMPWNKLYRGPSMPLPKRPPDMENLWVWVNRVQNRYKYRDAGIDDNLVRMIRAYYYATVSFIDYNVGRILSYLEDSGDLDNTLIVWTSDHGEYLGDYNCFGKRTFMKSAANVPLVVRYPERFRAGCQVDAPVSLVDVMPTLLASSHIDGSQFDLDGIDLAALATDPDMREIVYGQYQRREKASYMALSRRWKYIYAASDQREYLFDLLVDPEETRNRAQTLGYLEHTAAMRAALIGYFQREGYTEPLDGDTWRAYATPSFPQDPDAGLLFQDPRWARSRMRVPGYTDDAAADARGYSDLVLRAFSNR